MSFKSGLLTAAAVVAFASGAAFAQAPTLPSSVASADAKERGSEQWRLAHRGNTAAAKRANDKDRLEIARRDHAATAVQRADANDAGRQKWRLAHKGDTAVVQRANTKDQARIDYRNKPH